MTRYREYIAGAALTILVLAVAAWLPSLVAEGHNGVVMQPVGDSGSRVSRAERAELSRQYVQANYSNIDFVEYQNEDLADFESTLPASSPDSINKAYTLLTDTYLIFGEQTESVSGSVQGVIVTSLSSGESVKLLRIMFRNVNDWNTWHQVVMDAETADVYFFYVSSQCLDNERLYWDNPILPANPPEAAVEWGKVTGRSLLSTDWNGVVDSKAMVTYLDGDEEVSYQISCFYRKGQIFDMMVTMQGTKRTVEEDLSDTLRS